jgi:hypothetical protein
MAGLKNPKILFLLGAVFLCCICSICMVIVAASNPTPKTDNKITTDTTSPQSTTPTTPEVAPAVKPKEGDVISGVGRIEIENNYNAQKKQSDVKAQVYADGLKGQQVVWVVRVTEVSEELFGDGYEVRATMQGYTTTIKDPSRQFGDLNKGDLIKVTANIDSLVDVIGINLYLNQATIEKI